MHVHRLTFRAFGPYPQQHEIDFDSLSASGLFLLTGPTGSGKSTVIDAITFALYGDIEGSQKERLHSHHADPDVEPFVELVFSTASGLYRVWRTPEYQRPKKRGDGTTTQKSQAKLFRLTDADQMDKPGSGEPVSTPVAEASRETAQLIGLTKEQFLQTIVLPQGKFARFLTSRPDDRRSILQSIFATGIYEKTQKNLTEEAKAARAEEEKAAQQVEKARAVLWAEHDVPDSADDRSAGDSLVKGLEARASETRAAAESAQVSAQSAAAALENAVALENRIKRRSAAHKTLKDLEERAAQIAQRESAIARSNAAALVKESVIRAGKTAQDLADATAQRDVALATCQQLDLDPHLPKLATELETRSQRLVAAQGREQELDALQKLQDARRAEYARTIELRGANQATLDAVPEQLNELQNLLSEAKDAASRQEGLNQAVEAHQEDKKRATKLDAARTLKNAADTAFAQAHEAAVHARTQENELRERWLAGLAGELAQTLHDGASCPVCGSETHPNPAIQEEDSVSREDVAKAAEIRERNNEAEAEAGTRVAEHRATVESLEAELGERETTWEKDLAAAILARDTNSKIAASVEKREEELADLQKRHAELSEIQIKLDKQLTQLDADMKHAESEITKAQSDVDDARGTFESLEAAVADVHAKITALDAYLEASTTLASAQPRAEEALKARDDVLAAHGFASPTEAREAELSDDALTKLVDAKNADDDSRSAATGTLNEPEIAALTGEEDAQVQPHRAAEQVAREAAKQAHSAAELAAKTAATARTNLAALITALDAHAQATASSAPLLAMERLASGNNERSMQLATFVLVQRFEAVVAAANRRLSAMSDGRYELERSDEETGQRARGQGLGLTILDHSTEIRRSPHSLSGGETFYTSLSLALGLADVVTDESGGLSLGTLFVDEGFGSLDEETLDAVMGVLHALADNGRSVGIVSHVADLRQQIAEQIRVSHRANGKGSTLAVLA